MDRRSFLTMGTTGVAALSGNRLFAAPRRRSPDLAEWAADFTTATDSVAAGFGAVQRQHAGGGVDNGGPPIPVVDHPVLGRALRMTLNAGDERLEAATRWGVTCGEGDDWYFRVDFLLDKDFPLNRSGHLCMINQIHQSADSGPPPVEFDVHDGRLWVRGNGGAYQVNLCPVAVETPYSLVYRVIFAADPRQSWLEVWVNGVVLLGAFHPACAPLDGGRSDWKGATMCCAPNVAPLTVYQNAHQVGYTYSSVTGVPPDR